MENIFVLDRNKVKKDILSNHGSNPPSPFFNDIRKINLNTGAETLEFDTFGQACFNGYLNLGNYVMFREKNKYYMYQIMEMETEHEDDMIKNCYCETVGLELRNHTVRAMTIDCDVKKFFETILVGSPFKLGYVDKSITGVKSVKIDKPIGAYQLIQDNLSIFDIEIEFTVEYVNHKVTRQLINVYRQRGKETNIRFEYGNNVDKVKKTEDLSEFCTALVGIGSGGCDFKDNEWSIANGNPVNKPINQDFVADMDAFNFKNNNGSHIMGVFEGNSDNGADLLLETWNELQRIKVPKIDYEFNIALLNVDEVDIGDTIYCIDNDYDPPLHLSARISELELSETDITKNKCKLSNYKVVKSKIKSLNKEDIMNEVLDYLDKLEVGLLTEADLKILREYLEQLNFTEAEIDALFAKYKDVLDNVVLSGKVIDLAMEHRRYYKCSTLDKLTLNVSSSAKSDFKSVIEFNTGSNCYPMMLNQSNDIWMVGEDCKNGALINKADTKYRITVTYINNVTYPRKFRGDVSIISRGAGEYLVYPKFSHADEIINLSLQYYNNRNLFKYNQLTPLSYYSQGKDPKGYVDKWRTNGINHIDCSTFTNSLYRARGYDNSIYKNLDYGMAASKKYGWGFDIGRTASAQAEWCIKNGYQLDISTTDETDWWNLMPGDLVFWSARTESSETGVEGRYMQVGHVAIVRTPKTSSGTTTTMEVSTSGNVVLNRALQINFPEKLLFFARVRR